MTDKPGKNDVETFVLTNKTEQKAEGTRQLTVTMSMPIVVFIDIPLKESYSDEEVEEFRKELMNKADYIMETAGLDYFIENSDIKDLNGWC